jgi:hypothetical protein
MRGCAASLAGASAIALLGAACSNDAGYIEIKTVPASTGSVPSLYLDSVKLEGSRKGTVVLRQQVGTTKLQSDAGGGHLSLLCDIVVKKNRITTVTVSVLERPPRCQCRTSGTADAHSPRTCIG